MEVTGLGDSGPTVKTETNLMQSRGNVGMQMEDILFQISRYRIGMEGSQQKSIFQIYNHYTQYKMFLFSKERHMNRLAAET